MAWDYQDRRDQPGPQDPLAQPVLRDYKDQLEGPEVPVPRGQLDHLVHLDLLDLLDHRDRLDQLDQQDLLEVQGRNLDPRVVKDQTEIRELLVTRATRDQLEEWDHQVS